MRPNPSSRIFCIVCKKAKLLFASEQKADNFIRFNAEEIAKENEKVPTYVSTEYLLRELPGFDWTGGKAGRVLPEALATKLEDIWTRYTKKLHDEGSIDGERASQLRVGRYILGA